MSLRATLWAYDEAPVEKPTELLVLIALADEANDAGRNAFPSVAKIAKRARCQPRAAKYALRALEADGIIVLGDQAIAARHIARADRRPKVYDLVLSATWENPPVKPANEPGATDAPRERGAPEGTNGVHEDVERGAPEGTNGVHGGAPDPTNDPKDDPTDDPKDSAADATAAKIDPAAVIAEAWWEHYAATFGPIVRNGRTNPFIALRDHIVRSSLEAGWTENEIKRALLGPPGQTPDPVPSKGLFQRRLSEVRNGTLDSGRNGRTLSNLHDAPDSPGRAQRDAVWQ